SFIASNVGVQQREGTNVPVTTSYPSLSILNTTYSAYTQKVGVLIGNGFNDKEVMDVLHLLEEQGAFIVTVGEKLGTVSGANGTKVKGEKTLLTSSPYLLDYLYIVGGNAMNAENFNQQLMYYANIAYSHFKPIGV